MTRWPKSLLWLAMVSLVVACADKPGDLRRIGGTINGLTGTGLVLQLNGGHDLTVAASATTFLFDAWMVEDTNYSVTVGTPPANPTQTCLVSNGSGTVGSADVTNIEVNCTPNTYTVSGSVTGLTGSGLVLLLNDQNDLPVSGNTSFTFTVPVVSGATYEVTVGVYPTNPVQSCTVENGTGPVTSADITNVAVKCTSPLGMVSTLAGTAGQIGSTDATGANARFDQPRGVAVDGDGNIHVADSGNNTIRKITPAGVVSTPAGTAGQRGSTDNPALFNAPIGVTVDGAGNVYVADSGNHTIRKITPAGVVSTLAGTAGQIGSTDATGASARFDQPCGVAVDGDGNIYVADLHNNTIRKITPAAVVSTWAGAARHSGSTDATGAAARFNHPSGIAVDIIGNVYVADTDNNTIRKITP